MQQNAQYIGTSAVLDSDISILRVELRLLLGEYDDMKRERIYQQDVNELTSLLLQAPEVVKLLTTMLRREGPRGTVIQLLTRVALRRRDLTDDQLPEEVAHIRRTARELLQVSNKDQGLTDRA